MAIPKGANKKSRILTKADKKSINPYLIAFFVFVLAGSAIFEIIAILFKWVIN